MTGRPYFKKSIAELEVTFDQSLNDGDTLDLLLQELEFRSTQRASDLKDKAQAAAKKLKPISDAACMRKNEQVPTIPTHSHDNYAKELEKSAPTKKARSKLPVVNNPQDILRTWTALEVLSPQGYRRETDLVAGNKARIARFEESELPWVIGEKSLPKKRLYYELILGAVELAPAVDALLRVYSDNRPNRPSAQGYCPVASIVLDKDGRPLEDENSFTISSFAWGVPVALRGDLKALADWPYQERSLVKDFKERLIKWDRDGEIVPLTKKHILELFAFLSDTLGLAVCKVKPPYFAVRRYEFFASKTPPEPGLLNSFFLDDLAAARTLAGNGALPHALKHYLGIEKPPHRTDLLQDDAGLQNLLQPASTPLGRWPASGRFPLALLQQAAVNAANPEHMQTGILAVNGPPGTGKTTLLRDVVAARIVERAEIMSGYDKPANAFTTSNQSLQRSGAKITLHRLDESLKGFEMVVTSSNNKAVENVSAELPALGAIAADAEELRYFKAIADNVLERETWGLIAAVLGNSNNRYIFSQSFWRDDEQGLSTYLNHACGIPQVISEPQESGPPIKRNRKIVDLEQPPANAREAAARWNRARNAFIQARDASKVKQAELQKVHAQLVRLISIAREITVLQDELPVLEKKVRELTIRQHQAEADLVLADERKAFSAQDADRQADRRPGFFARLLKTKNFRNWLAQHKRLREESVAAAQRYSACKGAFDRMHVEYAAKVSRAEQTAKAIRTLVQERATLEVSTRKAHDELGAPVPDADFFGRTHEDIQMASVWYDRAASRLRDDVFEAAIRLHRAFIDCAADPLRQNLSVFVESFGTRSLGTPAKDAMIADLWASFFLVVPVVSTTFASVHRMFSRLAPETLGWLLVDEAGQAVPQATVGAMLRTKRSVVVGDPLQIEPVVTLPNSLTEEICGHFGVDPLKYNAPEASVQTVADAASMYCACFPIGSGHRDVGAPLLVHRRCDSPMFEVSNEIAYSNLMVTAKRPSGDNPVLGRSSWIDVVGKPGPDKWCADEAVALIGMLHKLRESGAEPDLYVVTPFVIVQDNLRRELVASGILDGWVDKPGDWVRERVGTVHTVQGREAGIVFFVLGAQMSSQNGARAWAGGRPNLVNVAVTRAKASLYVIGNRQLWKSAGVFIVLDRHL